jgi:hypothetical protein
MQDAFQGAREHLDAGEVLGGEVVELFGAGVGEQQAHPAPVDRVALAPEQPRGLRAADVTGTIVNVSCRLVPG